MKKVGIFLAVIAIFFIIIISFGNFVGAVDMYNNHCDSIPGSTIGTFGIIGEITSGDCNTYIGGDNCYRGYVVSSCGYGCSGNNCHAQLRSPATGWWIEPCSYFSACVDVLPCTKKTWYYDSDSDGYASATYTTTYYQCASPDTGWRSESFLGIGDCNDNNANIHPGVIEICDALDNNCNNQIDENLYNYAACNQVGACFSSRQTCSLGVWGTCSILPQTEIFDTIDNNCNGLNNEGFSPPIVNIALPVSGRAYNSSVQVLDVLTNEAVNNCGFNLDSTGYLAMILLNSTHFTNLFTTLSEGNHFISVNCTDTDGQSSLASVSFVTDTIPPAINIISPNSIFYDTRDIDVELTSDGTQQAIWYNWDGTNRIYSGIETITFNEGWNTLTAYVNDSLGNQNSRAFTFFVDTIAPILTITNPATNGEMFGTNDIPIEYTLVESNAVNCWWTNDSSVTIHDLTCGDNITGQLWAEGLNSVQIYAVDILGHVISDTRSFNIDNSAPIINIITPTAGGIFGGNVLLSASIADSNLDLTSPRYEIRENGIGGVLNSSGALIDAGGVYDGNLLTDDTWGNRNLTLIVFASDIYGKSSSASVDFILDNTVPSITFINPMSDNSSRFNNNFNLNILVQGEVIASAQYAVYDPLGSIVASNLVTPNINSHIFNDLIDISVLLDGAYTILASVTDSSVPADSVSASASFILDRTNPLIIDVFPVNGAIYNYSCLDVNVTFDDGNAWFIWNGTTYAFPLVSCFNFDEGANSIEVHVNDTTGNGDFMIIDFIIDTLAPTVQFVDPTEIDDSIINRNNILVNVTADGSGTGITNILINLYDAALTLINSNNYLGSPNFMDFTSLVDGVYYFNAIALDNAGNSASTETRSVTIDTIPPVLTIVAPTSLEVYAGISPIGTKVFMSNSSEVYLEVSGNEDLGACWYTILSASDMIRTSSTNFNAVTSGLSEERWPVTISCNDTAGNIGTAEYFELGVDLTAPELTINSPQNLTYNVRDILVNISSIKPVGETDEKRVFWQSQTIWYNWNGTDSVYSPGFDRLDVLTTLLENARFSRGSNTLIAYVNDTAGNTNTQSVTFFVDIPVTIVNSQIYGTYYPYNISSDVINLNFVDSSAGNSTIEGTIPVDVIISYIMRSNLTNLTLIYNCTAIDSTITGGGCQDSTIIFSVVTESNITWSYVENSTVLNSSVFNSTLIEANLTNSIVDNSNIINSTIDNSIVENASIIDGVLLCGNITFDGLPKIVSNCIDPINLTDIINYAPTARLFINPTTANVNDLIFFSAAASTDPNIPGALNDSLNYTFDFGDGSPLITGNIISLSRSYASAGNYIVNLIVTDSFGESNSILEAVVINSAVPGPGPGSSGSSGSSSSIPWTYQAGPGNKIYWPTGEELARGYTVSMRLREVIKFFVEYKLYYFETTNLTKDNLDAEIRWPVKLKDFAIGESKNIDVNDDGHEDVNIRLNTITFDGIDYFASVTMKRLFKEGQTAESDVPPGTIFVEAQTTNKFMQFMKNNWIIILAIVLALVALGIATYYYLNKRKMQTQVPTQIKLKARR